MSRYMIATADTTIAGHPSATIATTARAAATAQKRIHRSEA